MAEESDGTPSWTTIYSGITTRLSTISPELRTGFISSSGIFGGNTPHSVFAGILITLADAFGSTGLSLTGWTDSSPENISEPDIVVGSYPGAVMMRLYSE